MVPFLARNWFILTLPVVIVVAALFPGLGADGGPLHPEVSTRWAVVAIFLFQGLSLPSAALRSGARNWRLHLLIQGVTFLVFPAMVLVFDALAGRLLRNADLRMGFLLLGVLPSTVSSSVVFTQQAGGNTGAAIFNAALSNLIGLLVTPLWVAWLTAIQGRMTPITGKVAQDILLLMLLPVGIGQITRWFWTDAVARQGKRLGTGSSLLILFLIFCAFADSIHDGLWRSAHPELLSTIFAITLALFLLILGFTLLAARWMTLPREDRITAAFCAPQKTIAAGIPLAKALFGSHPGLGLILLPVLIYHPIQLVLSGILANRWRGNPKAGDHEDKA
jgi:sodium/bile acid cotransporter 7